MSRLVIAVLALAVTAPLAAQQRDDHNIDAVVGLIDRYVEQSMQAKGTPGVAVALVNRDSILAVRTYGHADVDRREPVTPATRFQIGSITKSITALATLQLADAGKLDLKRPVQDYLPWFTPKSRYRLITAHDLLTHTSGLTNDQPEHPSPLAQAYFARERTVGSAPGAVFAYSNTGYQVLTALLESLSGKPYADVVRERVLLPLGLPDAMPVFTHAQRLQLATSYAPLYDDRPVWPSDPLVPTTWLEYGTGDGSVVLTPVELGTYLVALLNRGQTANGRLVSERSFQQLLTAQAPGADGADRYAYGLYVGQLDGHAIFRHGGRMLTFRSYFIGEPELGIGALVLMNAAGESIAIARYALRALGAAMRGDRLPEIPASSASPALKDAAPYAGTYVSASRKSLVFAAEADSLVLVKDSSRVPLLPYGEKSFLGPRPEFALFPIVFDGDATGITEVWYGGEWFAGERYNGPRSFPSPARWAAYPGHYKSYNPWSTNFRVVLRKGNLWRVSPDGNEQSLTAISPNEFRIGDGTSAERLIFDAVVDGQALRATVSGMPYYRFFTP